MEIGMQFENVTAIAKANIYFEGNVISHTILMPDGARKTLGVILPGQYYFGTEAAELMEIVGGHCEVVIDDSNSTDSYDAGTSFNVPANSGFTITVTDTPCHYVCSFL